MFTKKCGLNKQFVTPAVCANQIHGDECLYKGECAFIELYARIEVKINMSLITRVPIEPSYIVDHFKNAGESDYIIDIKEGV